MGTDMHIYTEARVKQGGQSGEEGVWRNIDEWKFPERFSGKKVSLEELAERDASVSVRPICDNRDYQFFTILASARRRENTLTPISLPKGLPYDVSKIVELMDDTFGGISFCHSHLTLRELKESVYYTKTPIKAWVHKDDKKLVDLGENTHISPCHEDDLELEDWVYAQWADSPNVNFLNIVQKLEEKKARHKIENEDDIRIVFWFDC